MSKSKFKSNAQSYIMIMALIVITVIFSILTKGVFVSARNISMLARQTTVTGIIAVAMMFIIVAGHIDLSIGAVLGCCGTVAGVLQVWFGFGTVPTIICTLIVGVIIGIWNGYWVAYRCVPAFIATLGTQLIAQGINLGVGKGMAIAPMSSSFSFIGQGYLSKGISWAVTAVASVLILVFMMKNRSEKQRYGIGQKPFAAELASKLAAIVLLCIVTFLLNMYQGIPVPVIILAVLTVLFNFVANKTTYGRNVYAIGGNTEAANLAGVKTKLITMKIFIIGGILAACAGIVLTARLNSATAAAGDGMELDAIASCVLGGVSMSGGTGKISGVIIGALIMVALDNGMSIINLESFWQYIIKGLVLIVAVCVDMGLNEKKD